MDNTQLEYCYAEIDLDTKECNGVCARSIPYPADATMMISVPQSDERYIGKYYNADGDCKWYENAEFTVEFGAAVAMEAKQNYGRGLWTVEMVRALVVKDKITAEQYEVITGEKYEE